MSNRGKFITFVYSSVAVVVLTVTAVFSVAFEMLGIVFNRATTAAVGHVVDTCGCSQSLTTINPATFIMIGLTVLAILAVVIIILGRIIRALLVTRRLEKELRSNSIRTTVIGGIQIHRTQFDKPIAVCIGIWKPRIYVSTTLEEVLSGFELWAVLRHELAHAKGFDPIHRLLLRSIQPLFPGTKTIVNHIESLAEIAADESVGDDAMLSRALGKVLEFSQNSAGLAATFFSPTQLRINRLIGESVPRPRFTPLLGVVITLALVLGATYTAAAQSDNSQEVLSTCIQEQPMCVDVISMPPTMQSTEINMTTISIPSTEHGIMSIDIYYE